MVAWSNLSILVQERPYEWGWGGHPMMWGAWGFGMMIMMILFLILVLLNAPCLLLL